MLGQDCLLAEGDIVAPIYWRTEAPAPLLIIDESQFISQKIEVKWRTEHFGAPHLFHDNRLLTGLYKQETEILRRKDEGCIKK
jgi:hypothetical protein